AVGAPQQKRRVERAIRYLKDRFFAGRPLADRDSGNQQLDTFLRTIAPGRPHPQFSDRTVQQVLLQERQSLLSLPPVLPAVDLCIPVSVDKCAFLCFDTNWYSVPPAHAQSTLTLC